MHDSVEDDLTASRPFIDDDGLLRYRGRWIPVPDAQLPVVRLLVERFGHLVSTGELTNAYVAAGGSGHDSTYRSVVARIRGRVGQLGLELHSVRRRGVVLDASTRASPPGDRQPLSVDP